MTSSLRPDSSFHVSMGFRWVGVFFCSAMFLTGCRETTSIAVPEATSKSESPALAATSPMPNQMVSQTTTSVLPDQAANEVSPASLDDTDPRAICRRFLESLQAGNRIAAENLLTPTALRVTGKAGLVLEPLSGPDSQIEVGEPQYATIQNEIAYIACQFTEPEHSEGPFTVSWIVKKQNGGWRISGLIMELDEGRPQKMFSFENPNDVAEIKLRAAENFVNEAPVGTERQANLKGTESTESIK